MKVDESKNIAMMGFKCIILFSLKGSPKGALGRKANWLAKWFDVCAITTLGNALA